MKRRAVSNIAWPADSDGEALTLVAELGFSGIEVAPAKVFGPLDQASMPEMREYRAELQSLGLEIPALQGILFGVTGVHLFHGDESRRRLADRLRLVAGVAQVLGAKACVFGAPSLRDPGEVRADEAWSIAVDFFRSIAPAFEEAGAVLAFEAIPTIHNCRFVTHTGEALALMEEVDTRGFGLQLDTGTIFANGEDQLTLAKAARVAAHCHASEPNLTALGTSGRDHASVGKTLAAAHYPNWVSVEMKATDDWALALRNSAKLIRQAY